MPADREPDTVTEAIAVLRGQGYVADYEIVDGALVTGDQRAPCPVERAEVERLYRFEGPSDPGDEMIVFGLHDPLTGVRGTLATAFGPTADPELHGHLAGLRTRFRHDG